MATMTRSPGSDRPLRADAARNRDRIVEAAVADFAEHGLEVPLEDVAQHAGVGIATLYRRFPSRDDLVAACFERRVAEYAQAAEDALGAPGARRGLTSRGGRPWSARRLIAATQGFDACTPCAYPFLVRRRKHGGHGPERMGVPQASAQRSGRPGA
jgi:AcrR family transcriptional regulator